MAEMLNRARKLSQTEAGRFLQFAVAVGLDVASNIPKEQVVKLVTTNPGAINGVSNFVSGAISANEFIEGKLVGQTVFKHLNPVETASMIVNPLQVAVYVQNMQQQQQLEESLSAIYEQVTELKDMEMAKLYGRLEMMFENVNNVQKNYLQIITIETEKKMAHEKLIDYRDDLIATAKQAQRMMDTALEQSVKDLSDFSELLKKLREWREIETSALKTLYMAAGIRISLLDNPDELLEFIKNEYLDQFAKSDLHLETVLEKLDAYGDKFKIKKRVNRKRKSVSFMPKKFGVVIGKKSFTIEGIGKKIDKATEVVVNATSEKAGYALNGGFKWSDKKIDEKIVPLIEYIQASDLEIKEETEIYIDAENNVYLY
ncbi:hypothetical protein Hs30E_15440 [Lactococcus hodotermopsidis]|uniref:Uncharacterized protein n=1 Tax=Pseudolactococcus hodotermopsidis TaxID=2709157 RepID=A0A6A0BE69_9LACT|nr:hypothetical protein [Lactococcus hodotermopsidis]GFH42993.1 hypothetical protein Hs30E_15440 [Lactococcus hodotermopsidis]